MNTPELRPIATYWLQHNEQAEWVEVSKAAYISAERQAGFYPKDKKSEDVATGSFSSSRCPVVGKVVYRQPTLKTQLYEYQRKAVIIANQMAELVAGKRVRIKTNYNGQPSGRSKKSLKGTIQTVTHLTVEPARHAPQTFLWLQDHGQCWCAIPIEDVEFVQDAEEPKQEDSSHG